MEKRLILIRHAHRDTSNRSVDNGLSEKGKIQAKRLKRFAADQFSLEDFKNLKGEIISSPKKRCLETVMGIGELFGLEVLAKVELDERKGAESAAAFQERIHQFLCQWQKSPARLTILCGHGDWLPLAVFHLIGISIEMKKGSWLEIDWKECSGELKSYIPSLRSLNRK